MVEVVTPIKRQISNSWHATTHFLSPDVFPNGTLFKISCIGLTTVEMCLNTMGESGVLFSENSSMSSCRSRVRQGFSFQSHAYLNEWAHRCWLIPTNRFTGPNTQLGTGRSIELYWNELKTRISRRGCACMRDSFPISISVKDYMYHVITWIP